MTTVVVEVRGDELDYTVDGNADVIFLDWGDLTDGDAEYVEEKMSEIPMTEAFAPLLRALADLHAELLEEEG